MDSDGFKEKDQSPEIFGPGPSNISPGTSESFSVYNDRCLGVMTDSPACVNWDFDRPSTSKGFPMDSLQSVNAKGPDNGVYELSKSPELKTLTSCGGPNLFNDLYEMTDSPAYVKWDTELPPVSEDLPSYCEELGKPENTEVPDNFVIYEPSKSPELKTLTCCESPCLFDELWGMTDSSAYVKWDFELPPASEATKERALQISREIHVRYHNAKREAQILKSQRLTPIKIGSLRRKFEESPSDLSYINSIKKLKEAIGEELVTENYTPKTESCPIKIKRNESNEGPSTDKCLYDDLFNSLLNDFNEVPTWSSTPEKKTLPNDKPVTYEGDSIGSETKKNPASSSHLVDNSPPESPKAPTGKTITPRNLCLEMDEDESLFNDLN